MVSNAIKKTAGRRSSGWHKNKLMKKISCFIILLMSLVSCKDLYDLDIPQLEVWTDQTTYHVGDSVKFRINANTNFINFYSGEYGNDYTYAATERIYDMLPGLSFRAAKFAGNNEDCASLLYSTDFNGTYTYENVKAATWKDISDRFTLPPIVGTSATFSDGGTSIITDLLEAGKPLYFAWYCKTNEGSQRTRFQVMNFNVNGVVTDNTELSGVLYSQAQLGFKWVLNEAAAAQETNKPSVTTSLVYWDGIFNNLDGFLKEGYAVSGPVEISEKINLGIDAPRVIKSMQNENMSEFAYRFDKAGEYEVAFVGYNVNFKGRTETVKKIKLIVEE